MNATREWAIRLRRVEMALFRTWATGNLVPGDAVVIETTTNVWDIYDIVAPLVTRTVVAHARAVRQIAEARFKTDTEDITPALAGSARERLLRLLIADIVPEVWVPPAHVRELRGLIAYRNRLVKTSTTPALRAGASVIRNRLHSLLHRQNLILPESGLRNRERWGAQAFSTLENLQMRQELDLLEQVEHSRAELDDELAKMSTGKVWGQQAARILQLPGLGVIVTLAPALQVQVWCHPLRRSRKTGGLRRSGSRGP